MLLPCLWRDNLIAPTMLANGAMIGNMAPSIDTVVTFVGLA
jgi:hypothetical protein